MPGERYRRGSHTVLELKYHFVWKTKYAYRVLKEDVGLRLRALIRQVCEEHQMSVLQGNIRPDHVHLLVSAPSWLSPAKMAQVAKGEELIPATAGVSAPEKEVLGAAPVEPRVFLRDGGCCYGRADQSVH